MLKYITLALLLSFGSLAQAQPIQECLEDADIVRTVQTLKTTSDIDTYVKYILFISQDSIAGVAPPHMFEKLLVVGKSLYVDYPVDVSGDQLYNQYVKLNCAV